MCAGVSTFPFMNVGVKLLAPHYPAAQITWARFTGHLIVMLVVFLPQYRWALLRTRKPAVQIGRSVLMLASNLVFVMAIGSVPLATASAIGFTSPLIVTALSVPLLREQVGWRRWSAVAVGFVGVIVMLDPLGISFHAMSLIVLAATFCYSLSTVMVRMTSRYDHDAATLFWFALVSSVLSLVAGAPEWIWPTAIDWVWLILLGSLGGIAQVLVTRAWRLAPASVLAPFDYASIVLAVLYGYLWFHEEPSWTVWLGLPLVIGSGLYILHRERVRGSQRAMAALP